MTAPPDPTTPRPSGAPVLSVRHLSASYRLRGALVPAALLFALFGLVAWWQGRRDPPARPPRLPARQWIAAVLTVVFVGGLLGGLVLSLVFAVSILRYKADHIVAGIAINLLALGVTGFLLKSIFDAQGVFRPTDMVPLPQIEIPLIADLPVVGDTVSGHTPLVYLTFIVVAITWVALYRMPAGLRLRSVGEQPDAARTAGIRVDRVRYQAIVWSGLLCGLAGAHLALGYSSEFTENMTQGRGFTAFVAAVFGLLGKKRMEKARRISQSAIASARLAPAHPAAARRRGC